jgi:ferric-dicitrate binding protein FerR (iron transport regulator)
MFFKLAVVFLSLLLSTQPETRAASSSKIVGQIAIEGTAEINGAVAPKGGTVFVGDHVVTQGGANASLALTGGTQLILVEASSLHMQEVDGQMGASLTGGALAVFTRGVTNPIVVEAGGARIRTGKEGAVYAVTLTGEKLQVFSKTGTTEVAAANRTIEVHEGETLEATMSLPTPPQRPAGAGSSSPLWGNFDKVLIIVGVAAGVTGLVVAVRALQKTCTATPSPFKVNCN